MEQNENHVYYHGVDRFINGVFQVRFELGFIHSENMEIAVEIVGDGQDSLDDIEARACQILSQELRQLSDELAPTDET